MYARLRSLGQDGHTRDSTVAMATPPDARHKKRGFECEFVQRPPTSYPQTECPVCLLVLNTPHLISCCGQNFCKECIDVVRREGNGCPLCNAKEFSVMYNRAYDVSLKQFEVYCTHRKSGCDWKDQLGKLDKHLNVDPEVGKQMKGCDFVEVKCRNIGCEKAIQRCLIHNHQNNECPKRPFSCEYCSYETTYDDVTTKHLSECKCYPVHCPNKCIEGTMERQSLEEHLGEACPLQVVECEFKHAGCETKLLRKDMLDHMIDSKEMARHMSLIARQNRELIAEITKLKLQGEVLAPVRIVMTDFQQHKRDNDQWVSIGFYTHPRGYKMCLNVCANGELGGDNTYVCCSIGMMRGKFDSHLKWPFQGNIILKLLNQRENKSHHSRTLIISGKEAKVYNSQVTVGEVAKKGWGCPDFISHNRLGYNAATNCQYLMNDCLCFQVEVKVSR